MMDNPTVYAFWISFIWLFTEAAAGQYCTKYSYRSSSTNLFYCSTSCCGSLYTRYCCYFTLGISLISGIVVSVLIAFGVLVAVVCICMKKKGMRGRVVQPVNSKITVVYTGTTTQSQGYNNGINGPVQPGFYNNRSGQVQPGYHNYPPLQPMQSGYQSTNPTGMVQPAYPPSYPSGGSGHPSGVPGLTPYTGSAIPPPYNYMNPDSVPGEEVNQGLPGSSTQRRRTQQAPWDMANVKQMQSSATTPVE